MSYFAYSFGPGCLSWKIAVIGNVVTHYQSPKFLYNRSMQMNINNFNNTVNRRFNPVDPTDNVHKSIHPDHLQKSVEITESKLEEYLNIAVQSHLILDREKEECLAAFTHFFPLLNENRC